MRALTLSCMIIIGCNRARTSPVDAATPMASAPVTASASASVPVRRVPSPREVVDAWNTAHTKHDSKALAALYAPHVKFYGRTLAGAQCAAAKKAAFAKSPDYAQSIRDVVVGEDGVVTFTKTSTIGGKSTDYPAVLVVASGVVIAETDKVTEANLAVRARKDATWCLDGKDSVRAPFHISASAATARVEGSMHLNQLNEGSPTQQLHVDYPIACPTTCDRASDQCGYEVGITAFHHLGNGYDPDCQCVNFDYSDPQFMEWVYVDGIDGTLWYDQGDDGKWQHSEATHGADAAH